MCQRNRGPSDFPELCTHSLLHALQQGQRRLHRAARIDEQRDQTHIGAKAAGLQRRIERFIPPDLRVVYNVDAVLWLSLQRLEKPMQNTLATDVDQLPGHCHEQRPTVTIDHFAPVQQVGQWLAARARCLHPPSDISAAFGRAPSRTTTACAAEHSVWVPES